MPPNFPSSPSLNQTYSFGGVTWQWNGTVWKSIAVPVNTTGLTGATGWIGSTGLSLIGATGFTGSSGAFSLNPNDTITTPTIINYTEVFYSIGTVTTSYSISLTNGTVQSATLTASTTCAFTMPSVAAGKKFTLLLLQQSGGNGNATFSGVKFPNGSTSPTITSRGYRMDAIDFVSDGVYWYGSVSPGYSYGYYSPLYAIFGYGFTASNVSMTNLVSNTGVVASDTTGVGTARNSLAAAGYGVDKAIFGYGTTGSYVSLTNLVSNAGVVATDTTGVGTARYGLAAAGYGVDKAIFGYGYTGSYVSLTNLVSNTGVVATDTTGVGTARYYLAAASYG